MLVSGGLTPECQCAQWLVVPEPQSALSSPLQKSVPSGPPRGVCPGPDSPAEETHLPEHMVLVPSDRCKWVPTGEPTLSLPQSLGQLVALIQLSFYPHLWFLGLLCFIPAPTLKTAPGVHHILFRMFLSVTPNGFLPSCEMSLRPSTFPCYASRTLNPCLFFPPICHRSPWKSTARSGV